MAHKRGNFAPYGGTVPRANVTKAAAYPEPTLKPALVQLILSLVLAVPLIEPRLHASSPGTLAVWPQ